MVMGMQCADIHIHSSWSDGDDSVRAIAENAIRHDLSLVGICDHYPAGEGGFVSGDHLSEYVSDINDTAREYEGKVKIIKGVEIPCQLLLYDSEKISMEALNDLDYILIENCESINDEESIGELRDNLSVLGCAKGLAHCDILRLGARLGLSIKSIAMKLKEFGFFWEINSAYRYAFFDDIIYFDSRKPDDIRELFYELNCNEVGAAAGSDCHSVADYEYGRLLQANKTMRENLRYTYGW